MKISSIIYSVISFLVLTSCGENEHSDTAEISTNEHKSDVSKINSSTIYSRGQEAARKALEYAPESKEREAELIRAHAIISTLEDSGYRQSAADFKAGMKSIL